MLLILFTQGVFVSGVDLSKIISSILPTLGASSVSDLVWWTKDELYQWGDEAAQRLSRNAGVWVEYEDKPSISTASVPLPSRHLSTIHVAAHFSPSNVSIPLRPSSVQELEALDSTWESTTGVAERYSQDYNGLRTLRLYPTPAEAILFLRLVYHVLPWELTEATPTLSAPSAIGDYLAFSIIAEARRREGDGAMPEIAVACDERVRLLEQVIRGYWSGGGAQ